MRKIGLLFILISFSTGISAQLIREIKLNYSSSNDHYFVVEPKGNIQGALVLLPGSYQEAESIFPETKLHNVAYLHNLLVVAFTCGKTKAYIDDQTLENIDTVLDHVIKTFHVPKDKFAIGGYSAGGVIALTYAEHCKQYPHKAVINPQAVFTADSPVDLVDVWYTFNREVEKNFSEAAMNEAKAFLKTMKEDLNGTPHTNLENYIKHSPFYSKADDGGNAKYLLQTAVRLYHDPDILWQLKNRRRSLFDMNILCASAMVNYLLLQGNEKAELMIADRPGTRSDGFRHPHSWSIIEEVDCILWIKKSLGIE
ncbi:alpha/beta hydrolase family protein [Marinifilum caeruleilacunae]|uniref:Alpha/beta hydrolase n=1 Tax=Marinifilum caeruleilacunae TaxID=2499076 RepID=A0ABX1WQY2_9BACT|nr:hypothetical protein [Marinifilum caeruleilacunae]NOU58494.1 hypothetical protein [Marinifilum caeruleilacunae]